MQNVGLLKKVAFLFFLSIVLITGHILMAQTYTEPVKVGIVGLSHDHVHWILGRPEKGDIKIVGIVEANTDLAQRYSTQYGYSMDMVFNTMEEMITQ